MSLVLSCYSTCLFQRSLPLPSCASYDGVQCTSVFGQANITDPFSSSADSTIATQECDISNNIYPFSTAVGQNFLNHILLLWCIAVFRPCSGSVWCDPSKEELQSTVVNACNCSSADSCIVNGFNVPVITAQNIIDYYEGNSTTGAVGNSGVTCQEVTIGKRCIMHTVVALCI